jgi:hypothetical protein
VADVTGHLVWDAGGLCAMLRADAMASSKKKRAPTPERRAAAQAVMASLPKLSETMLEFGKPLLDLLPTPPKIEQVRNILQIVTVAWNLPLYERDCRPEAAEHRATVEQVMAGAPTELRKILSEMLYARLTKYANDPRIGFLEVHEGTGGDARVIATGALME